MTFGEKLSKIRKEKNITQEQLAEKLGVSRQAISKWESNTAFPETEKLIKMSELFDCSLDYLLKDSVESKASAEPVRKPQPIGGARYIFCIRERKSEKSWRGLPLWQIGKNAKAVVAVGLNAKGIIAIGLMARGILSFGLFSIGIFAFGLLSLGLLASGALSLGGLAVGAVAVGITAIGAIALGIVSLGAISISCFSVGALAIGKYIAIGDHADAAIAIGDTQAVGTLFEKLGALSAEEIEAVKKLLDETVPSYLSWAKELIKPIIR